jgi:hypothetical protein
MAPEKLPSKQGKRHNDRLRAERRWRLQIVQDLMASASTIGSHGVAQTARGTPAPVSTEWANQIVRRFMQPSHEEQRPISVTPNEERGIGGHVGPKRTPEFPSVLNFLNHGIVIRGGAPSIGESGQLRLQFHRRRRPG